MSIGFIRVSEAGIGEFFNSLRPSRKPIRAKVGSTAYLIAVLHTRGGCLIASILWIRRMGIVRTATISQCLHALFRLVYMCFRHPNTLTLN